MALFDDDEEESNEEFMRRLEAQEPAEPVSVVNPDEDPLSIDEVVASAPTAVAPSVSKPFSLPSSDIVRPSAQDVVKQRIADLVKQRQEQSGKRKELAQEVQDADKSILSNIFAGIAGFGAGVRGGDVASGFNTAKNASMSRANRALSEFDKQIGEERQARGDESEARAEGRLIKQDERQDKAFATAAAIAARENDPNSLESQHAREYFKRLAPSIEPKALAKMTSAQIKALSPNYEKLADREYKKEEFQHKARQHEEDQKQRRDLHESGQRGANNRAAMSSRATIEAARIAAGSKAYESEKPSEKTVGALDENENTLNQLDNLSKEFNPSFVGAAKGTAIDLAPAAVTSLLQSPDGAAYRGQVGDFLSSYLHSREGTAMSEGARKALIANQPNKNDEPAVFLKKLQTSRRIIAENRETILKNRALLGENVLPFAQNDREVAIVQGAQAQRDRTAPRPAQPGDKPAERPRPEQKPWTGTAKDAPMGAIIEKGGRKWRKTPAGMEPVNE